MMRNNFIHLLRNSVLFEATVWGQILKRFMNQHAVRLVWTVTFFLGALLLMLMRNVRF